MDLSDNLGIEPIVLLVVVLVVSIAAGSLLMIAVSLLLLAILGGLMYRAHSIRRKLDRAEGEGASE